MRIISEYRDYYDAIQATGQDQTLLYLRQLEMQELKKWPFPVLGHHRYWQWWSRLPSPFLRQYVVGFCGKIYPVVLFGGTPEHNIYCHTIEDVDAFVEGHYKEKAVEEYRHPLKKTYHHRHWDAGHARKVFEKWFEEMKAKQNAFVSIFEQHKCPVFIADCHTGRHGDEKCIMYNGCLKDLEFYRVFDPFSAFQEIAMFLGGMAMPLKPIPHLSDEIIAASKGFDKYSFRKDKSKP